MRPAPLSVFSALAMLLLAAPAFSAERICDDATAKLVSDVYIQSIPVYANGGIEAVVGAHPKELSADGNAIKCMQRAVAALQSGALTLEPSAPRGQNGMGASGMDMGNMPPGMAEQMAKRMMGSGMGKMGDMSDMAGMTGMDPEGLASAGTGILIGHLNWLADTLPAATTGDFGPYQQGKPQIVRIAEQQMGMMDNMCRANPGMCAMMKQRMGTDVDGVKAGIFAALTGRQQP